jgi:hypothetical protein
VFILQGDEKKNKDTQRKINTSDSHREKDTHRGTVDV